MTTTSATLPPPKTSRVRIVTLGQVDHGKSTLVGRLLLDTGTLAEGKLAELEVFSKKRGLELELAFAVDALRAERDQGITIDAAHVWLKTGTRECVIVDAPGHEEFLKNMVSGAATADAALLLIDALEGIGEQSRRHALVVQLLGLEQVAVVVNKMDLVDWNEQTFRKIEEQFGSFLHSIGVERATFVPIAARTGANVTKAPAQETPWYRGPSVLELIDRFEAQKPPEDAPLRFALQDVYKFDDRRILAGRIESGTLRVGDRLVFSPWNKTGFVKTLERWSAPPAVKARAGESVGITLESQIFVERGQIGSHLDDAPVETDVFDARLFWLGREDLTTDRDYRLKCATQEVACRVERVHRVVDVATLKSLEARAVRRNGIADVTIRTRMPIAVDDFKKAPATGRFVLVDGYEIAGGGTISVARHADLRPQLSGLKSENITFTRSHVSRSDRLRRTGHRGRVIWFTGLSASGKSTISVALERALFDEGYFTYRLDGDNIRHGLSSNLGFSEDDRAENVRRVGEVAKLFCDSGVVVIAALISPRAQERDRIRATMRKGDFIEVHTDCPLTLCEQRDPKGLYRSARAGKIKGFTGIDAPYEPPANPEIELRTGELSIEECVARVKKHLRAVEALDPAFDEEDRRP